MNLQPTCGSIAKVFLCLQLLSLPALAHTPAEEMAAAANNFLVALSPEQQAKAVFDWKDEQRFDWHFIPRPRKGLPFSEMSSGQRMLAQALVSSALSSHGFAKAATIISLEQILFDMENRPANRNSDLYFFSVFGKPGADAWGWRVEGHHLSLNFALRGGEILGKTPSFFGANPAQVRVGPRKGLRVLAAEEDIARELVKSLDQDQRKIAIVTNEAPREIITGNDRKVKTLEPLGISAAKLGPKQKELLMSLLQEYVSRYRSEIAEADMKLLRQAGEDKITFAWAGGIEVGQPHYYRIQGPTFLMEYDNTQNTTITSMRFGGTCKTTLARTSSALTTSKLLIRNRRSAGRATSNSMASPPLEDGTPERACHAKPAQPRRKPASEARAQV